MRRSCVAAACALALIVVPRLPAAALPGDTLAAERTRLSAVAGLPPIVPDVNDKTRYITGRDAWTLTLLTHGDRVTSEILQIVHPGRYVVASDGRALIAALFTPAVAADLAASNVIARQQTDPDITQVFARGAQFGYRIVDDRRNGIHAVEVVPASGLLASMKLFGATPAPVVAGDAIYAAGPAGGLEPVALVAAGRLQTPPDAGLPPPKRVHVIFGNRIVADANVSVANGAARIALPAAVTPGHSALASAKLGASARQPRRAPTPAERAAALAVAAGYLDAAPDALVVRDLTAIDLGRGMSIAGTVAVRGTATPRVDKRLFFIAEGSGSIWRMALAHTQRVTVTEPLLEETGEYLVDALDLDPATIGVVTRVEGFDAHTFAIYTRRGALWKILYHGGGAAL